MAFIMGRELLLIIVVLLTLWLVGLSFLYFRVRRLLNRSLAVKLDGNLQRSLVSQEKKLRLLKDELGSLTDAFEAFRKEGRKHICYIGLVRFNPFEDTGGDQSFALCLLDGDYDGVVFSSMHGRSGTRVFSKAVRNAQAVEHELSAEEKNAVKNAIESNKR